MKKLLIIGIGALMLTTCILAYSFYLHGIDTEYAIRYSQIFGSYDINRVDKYLNEETVISYNGQSGSYKELRENVIHAFRNKQFTMAENSSYGHRTNSLFNRVYEVNVQSYVNHNNKSIEVPITMRLEVNGINKFSVKSLSSNNDFFGYLFFGINH